MIKGREAVLVLDGEREEKGAVGGSQYTDVMNINVLEHTSFHYITLFLYEAYIT